MTFDELNKEVLGAMVDLKPKEWRNGQFVFNYIDAKYGVARYVQFTEGVDCFYVDEYIDKFIEKAVEVINKLEKENSENQEKDK